MTRKEKLQTLSVVAEQSGADAVLVTTPADMRDDSRFFSFKRASETFTTQVQIFAKAKNDFAWQNHVIVIWKKGSTLPSDAEIEQSVAETLAKRILEITGKVPATATHSNVLTAAKTP
jgi:hypothetical protein